MTTRENPQSSNIPKIPHNEWKLSSQWGGNFPEQLNKMRSQPAKGKTLNEYKNFETLQSIRDERLQVIENTKGWLHVESWLQKMLIAVKWVLLGTDIHELKEIKTEADIDEIKTIFWWFVDFDDMGVKLSVGDSVKYDARTGVIRIFRKNGDPSGSGEELAWIPTVAWEWINFEESETLRTQAREWSNKTKLPAEAYELGYHVADKWPAKVGASLCWRAVNRILSRFWISNPPAWNGEDWDEMLDERVKKWEYTKVPINHPDEAWPWAILVYDGEDKIVRDQQWNIIKRLGSPKGREYGHVEIKWSDNKYYSYYSSTRPGGSAKSDQKDKTLFAGETWFTWYAYYPTKRW